MVNFIGNVEGRDAFSGNVDIVVTDGFTGNNFLKAVEGFPVNPLRLRSVVSSPSDLSSQQGIL